MLPLLAALPLQTVLPLPLPAVTICASRRLPKERGEEKGGAAMGGAGKTWSLAPAPRACANSGCRACFHCGSGILVGSSSVLRMRLPYFA